MREITQKDYYAVEYRLKELDKKFDIMRNIIKGRYYPIKKLILNEDGSLNEEKTEQTINDMLGSLKRYISLDREDRKGLTEDEEAAYRAFLYLALTAPGTNSAEFECGYDYVASLTLDDIVRLTYDEAIKSQSEEEMDAILESYQGEWGDFLNGCVGSFIYILDRFIVREEIPPEIEKERWNEDGYWYDYSLGINDSNDNFDMWMKYLNLILPDWEKYKKQLPDKENLKKAYAIYKHKIFTIDREMFSKDIEKMVDTFLFEQEISSLSFGKSYGLIDRGIKKKMENLSAEIERVRLIHEDQE